MLQVLRENTGNWIIKIFLFIIVLVFIFLGVGSMNASKKTQVASVNDEVITIKEFQEAYKSMVERMRRQFGNALNEDLLAALNIKQQAVNSLIDQKLLEMEADKLEIMVSDQEVQDTLMGIKAFQRDGHFDLDVYKQVLGRSGMTPEIYEAYQRQAIREGKLRQMVLNSITVTDAEANTWFTFQNTKKTIDYVEIDPAAFKDVSPTQEQVEKEYTEHKDKYQSQPKRKVEYLVFSPEDFAGKTGVTDEQIQAYYNQHIDRFKTPERVEASHILIRLDETADEAAIEAARKEAMAVYEKAVNGQAFDELAKEFSQGPSGPKGGYLGTFEKDAMVKPFGDVAFAMKEGEISKPVKTQFGWHVIKVSKRLPASVESLEQASEGIRKELEKEELNNMAYYKAGEAFDSVMDGDDFEQVALIANKKIRKTGPFTADGQGLEMDNAVLFAREAFGLTGDGISDVKQLGDAYYLMRVTEAIDPQPMALDEVNADIVAALTLSQQRDAAKKKAEGLIKEGESGKSLEDLAKEKSLVMKTSAPFTRTQPVKGIPGSAKITEAAFKMDDTGTIYPQVVEAGQKYYLISVASVAAPDEQEMKAGVEDVKREMVAKKQQQHYMSWLEGIRQRADITVNTDLIN